MRLGLDLGTNSIGWCLLDLDDNGDPKSIFRAGARIFNDGRDPKSLTSLKANIAVIGRITQMVSAHYGAHG